MTVITKYKKTTTMLEQAELSMCSEILLFLRLQTSSTYFKFKQAASRLTFESRARAGMSKSIQREGVWWRGATFWSRGFAALDFALAATLCVKLILEMSSAFAAWDATRTIHVEQVTSMTQCFYYYFRKQSVQNRGKKFNHKSYRIIPRN